MHFLNKLAFTQQTPCSPHSPSCIDTVQLDDNEKVDKVGRHKRGHILAHKGRDDVIAQRQTQDVHEHSRRSETLRAPEHDKRVHEQQ